MVPALEGRSFRGPRACEVMDRKSVALANARQGGLRGLFRQNGVSGAKQRSLDVAPVNRTLIGAAQEILLQRIPSCVLASPPVGRGRSQIRRVLRRHEIPPVDEQLSALRGPCQSLSQSPDNDRRPEVDRRVRFLRQFKYDGRSFSGTLIISQIV